MEVVAYLDESYDSFFNLSQDNGYFCMGVFLVPKAEISKFESHFIRYRQHLANAKGSYDDGSIKRELKSKFLRTIEAAIRREAISSILSWASGCGAVVGGFYTTTAGYIKYSLRTDRAAHNHIDSGVSDPVLIRQARIDIMEKRASQHAESLMIGDIALVIAGMLLYYCGERNMEFEIHYDPREEKEDKQVFQKISEISTKLEKILLGRQGVFQGCYNNEDSHNSCGIQMVDHVTRDLRQLFHQHPRLLTDSTSTSLITPEVNSSDSTIITKIGEKPFKWGEERNMSSDLVRSLFSPNNQFTLADYHQILMKHQVSCYSAAGEARIVDLAGFKFNHMVD